MAKEKKGKKKQKSAGPADALRDAVERTFSGAAEAGAATRDRAQEILEEVTAAVSRSRAAGGLLEAIERLRDEVQSLTGRVSALERRGGGSTAKPAAPAPRAAAKSSGTTRKPAASKAKASPSKAATSKASRSKASSSKASTSKSKAATSKASTSKASTSTRRTPSAGTSKSTASKPATSKSSSSS